MSVATARAIHTLLTHSKTNMKLSPHHLLCSSVALWRTASAFAPATSGSSTAAAAIRTFTSSSALHAASKMDQSFPTWSFDKHCPSMEWTELVETTLTASSSAAEDKSAVVDNGDLIMIGVYAPAKDDDDDGDKDDKSEEPPVISLTGMAAEIDQNLGGALSDVMADNHKAFQHGATAGATTPTLRVMVNGKVNTCLLCFICLL